MAEAVHKAVEMEEQALDFVRKNRTAAMVTTRPNGTSHVARCTIAVVDGKICGYGSETRVRTKHLRVNPNATLFVFDAATRGWRGIGGEIAIREGPDVPERMLAFQRALGREPENVAEFLRSMADEQRIMYEFIAFHRVYGQD
jgi:hypothetical protein